MMAWGDLVIVIAVALASAVAIGLIGLLVLYLAKSTSLMVQLCIVVVAAIFSVTIGMIGVAQAMYLSAHDLTVSFYVAGVAVLVSLCMALVLGHALTRNSERVMQLARSLSDGNRIASDTGEHRTQEFARLAEELAGTSRRLAESREEVAAIDASRRRLVAWISHDLRTPLASLRAMAEALEDGMAEDPKRFHRQMRSQVDHLSDMVDDLFELSKIQSGTLALSVEPLPLYDLVSDAVAELSSLAAARSIALVEHKTSELWVRGDSRELSRAIGNLLVNAIEHSPEGSTITIGTEKDETGRAVLSVSDSAGGIPEEDLPRIFEAGWRASSSRTPEQVWGRSTGAGLGLAIVQGIVQAHDGEITVRNVSGGCRFDVRLPRHDLTVA